MPPSRRLLPGLSVKDGYMQHPFDEAHGVRTSGLIAGRHLKVVQKSSRHATAYYGVAPSVFHALLRRWRCIKPAAILEETTFIDIGAGMGRALLLAAELPFHKAIGVELHPSLCRIARSNLAVWRRARRAQTAMQIVWGDGLDFALPAGRCLLFMFNPFGASVMQRLLTGLSKQCAARAGHLDVLYVNNEQEGTFEHQKGWTRLYGGKVKRSREDAIADLKILANQPEGEYASAPYEDCSIWRWEGRS